MPLETRVEHLQVWGAGRGWHTIRGELIDLSTGGVGMVLDRPLAPATPIRLAARAPSIQVLREGRVVYAAPIAGDLWRIGVAFPPIPPNRMELLGARVVCWGAIALVVTGFSAANLSGTELGSLALMLVLLLGLVIGAELTYRTALRRYQAQRIRWDTSPEASAAVST